MIRIVQGVLLGCLMLTASGPLAVHARSLLESDAQKEETEVVVTATRLGNKRGVAYENRAWVVTREQLDAWSGTSLADLLARVSMLDIGRRGAGQADLSMRGSGFEQVLVLIDGVPVTDPQTGHHNLDLPLVADDIERIEVLPGAGSSVYGPGAYSGVIHVVTRSGLGAEAVLRTAGGSFSTVRSSLSLAASTLQLTGGSTRVVAGGRLSAGMERTRGHRPGTEALSTVVSQGTVILHPGGVTRLRFGYQDKRFGADGFYAPYPSKEHTDTLLLLASSSLGDPDGLTLLPRLSFRRHGDSFVLDRNNPEMYTSEHHTQVLGAELALRLRNTPVGDFVLGLEHSEQGMDSSSLGMHDRRRTGVFVEDELSLGGPLSLGLGTRLDWGRQAEGTDFFFVSPSLALRLAPLRAWSVVLSVGRGFRLPSFTELYYDSPANRGDPELGTEETWAGDLTAVWQPVDELAISAAAFLKYDTDLVDWIKSTESDPWQATNIGSVLSGGGTLRVRWMPRPDTHLELGYTRLELDARNPATFSKYVFRQPVDDVLLSCRGPLVLGLEGILSGRFRRRPNGQGGLLLDVRIRRRFGPAEFHLEAGNILDVEEEEIPGVSLPGFHVMAGMVLVYR